MGWVEACNATIDSIVDLLVHCAFVARVNRIEMNLVDMGAWIWGGSSVRPNFVVMLLLVSVAEPLLCALIALSCAVLRGTVDLRQSAP